MSDAPGELVQPGFRAFVARIGGADGRAWIATLPVRLDELASAWGLTLGSELPGGLLACVVEATTADGADAVLKLPSPWACVADELASLRLWQGRGAPSLLAADEERGALLLERIRPGGLALDATAEDVAALLDLLHVTAAHGLPQLELKVRRRLERAVAEGRARGRRLEWAWDALARLAVGAPAPVLVHGDFDERNLLCCGRRGLCAIDPLPAVGDGAYDAAYWVHANGRPGRRARFDAMATALCLDHDGRARLRDWCGIVAVHG